MTAPSVDWAALLPEPSWSALSKYPAIGAVADAAPGGARGKAYYQLGEALRLGQEYDAAAWSYLAAHREFPPAAAYVNLGLVLQQGGRLNTAREAYKLALHHRPQHGEETVVAATNLARLTNASATRTGLLAQAVMAAPHRAGLHHDLGSALLAGGRAKEAEPALRRAVSLAPSDPHNWFRLGSALQTEYRLREAAGSFAAALALHPLHSVRTFRNDEHLTAEELDAAAARSVGRWAARATEARAEGGGERGGERSGGGNASDEDPGESAEGEGEGMGGGGGEGGGSGEQAPRDDEGAPDGATTCATAQVVDASSSSLEALLRRHADAETPTPVLLRGAREACATGFAEWARVAEGAGGAGEDAGEDAGEAGEAGEDAGEDASSVVPLAQVSEGGHTNRIGPLPGGLAPAVGAWLAREGVAHALHRPPMQHARLGDVLTLLRRRGGAEADAGACRRCYVKQLRLDMHAPSLLRRLRPPRLPRRSLGDAFLWLGGDTVTGLHTDARPNLLVMLAGTKTVWLFPPAHAARLRPARMLDLVANATAADGAAQLPSSVAAISLSENHFLDGHDAAWERLRGSDGGGACAHHVRAGDAVFIPPGWVHAVQSTRPADGSAVAAVNFFYDAAAVET